MRPGPARGTTRTEEVTVDATMTDETSATFHGADLPAVFGTLSMAEHAARTARALLDEHLESEELAVPGRIELIHRSPIRVGSVVQFEATVQIVEPTRVTCEIIVRTATGVAARAAYEQEIVARSEWLDRIG
jgi:predicted thioesterase